ncbi:prepilin-type N-terminal cleavage/methylation domain-containing protein [Marinobacter sp. tcs-11]|jgi:prepilin-type N-terminal cleavage/methylation domain-containing protein|uniref:prepilin-type N-terminal cleavage/methylation domain-containing protein n=1 Tax=Marinobacter sp. tcs-11 TaxID=1742860 RepID=UPI00258091CC|nr:prepilin-type N-terminal cleavage/methylation domain-containing protein [Marinobacter sp. tcs-11]
MTQYNSKQKQKGFTLIELVVVIAILAILAAFALPRFAQLSEQAHQSSIKGTAGALSAGVALAKAQWVTNGFTTATEDLAGFGDETVNISANGWPVSAGSQTYTGPANGDNVTMTDGRCVNVWEALLQANAPDVAASGTGVDYLASGSGSLCTYTYQLDNQSSTIEYNAANGEITTTIN